MIWKRIKKIELGQQESTGEERWTGGSISDSVSDGGQRLERKVGDNWMNARKE
jgi:hypothetical protein